MTKRKSPVSQPENMPEPTKKINPLLVLLGVGLIFLGMIVLCGLLWIGGLYVNPTVTSTTTVSTVNTAKDWSVMMMLVFGLIVVGLGAAIWGSGNNLFMWGSSYSNTETNHNNITIIGTDAVQKPEWMEKK